MKENETVYEHYFSTIEKMAEYIYTHCPGDCYECAFPTSIPCDKSFGAICHDEILNWLKLDFEMEE